MPPKCLQKAFKMPPKGLQKVSKMPPKTSKTPTKCLQNACEMPPKCIHMNPKHLQNDSKHSPNASFLFGLLSGPILKLFYCVEWYVDEGDFLVGRQVQCKR